MNNFWKKYQEYFILFFYIGIIGLLVWFVIKPLVGKINANANEIQKKIFEQENNDNRFKEIPKLKVQFEKILAKEEKLRPLLKENQAVELIEKIEKMANETNNKIVIEIIENENKGKTIKNVSSKGKEEEKNLMDNLPSKNYLGIKMNLIGSYGDSVDFIKKLENMEYPSDITAISLDLLKDAESQIEFNTSIEFDAIKTDKFAEKSNNSEIVLKTVLNVVFYLQNEKY